MMNAILFSTGADNFIQGLGIAFAGLIIVFAVLLLICGILYVFGRVFYKKPESAAPVQESAPAAAEVPAVAPVAVEEPVAQMSETELVAAITAAIACCLGKSTDGFVVRSFKRIGRKRGR